ncbi:MAG: hypothetical protein QJR05_04940 [Thermoanaerobacterium sp.]|nr:hypothetical protein [Thermoanaerobacterium sp.]
MPLTKRKVDFLETLIKLYDKEKAPVHYADVANFMGISKWTAYDMLTELEELGYVKRQYFLGEDKSMGRSILVYIPNENAYDVVNKSSIHEWNSVKEVLLNVIKKNDDSISVDDFMNEKKAALKPLKFCAYALTTLLLQIKTLDAAIIENIKNSININGTEAPVILFVGIVIGFYIDYYLTSESRKVFEKVNIFHKYIKELSTNDKTLLNNFLKESLLYI